MASENLIEKLFCGLVKDETQMNIIKLLIEDKSNYDILKNLIKKKK